MRIWWHLHVWSSIAGLLFDSYVGEPGFGGNNLFRVFIKTTYDITLDSHLLDLKKSGTLSFLCLSFILWFLQRRLKRILTLEIQKSEITELWNLKMRISGIPDWNRKWIRKRLEWKIKPVSYDPQIFEFLFLIFSITCKKL